MVVVKECLSGEMKRLPPPLPTCPATSDQHLCGKSKSYKEQKGLTQRALQSLSGSSRDLVSEMAVFQFASAFQKKLSDTNVCGVALFTHVYCQNGREICRSFGPARLGIKYVCLHVFLFHHISTKVSIPQEKKSQCTQSPFQFKTAKHVEVKSAFKTSRNCYSVIFCFTFLVHQFFDWVSVIDCIRQGCQTHFGSGATFNPSQVGRTSNMKAK